MTEVLPSARGDMSEFAPRIITIKINPEKIREIIGKGGATIRKIQEENGTEINVEDDGTRRDRGRRLGELLSSHPVDRVADPRGRGRGALSRQGDPHHGLRRFVEILPGKEGLVRIGELADYHVPTVEDVVQVGDEIMVVVIEIDRQGRVNLSRKAAMQRHLAKVGEGVEA